MFLKTNQKLKTQVIINPESNKGRTGKRWQLIKSALSSFIKEFQYEFTEKPNHAAEISRYAIQAGSELIIGVGGDGTLNEIANGFFEDRNIINPETALGVIPSGCGSDLSRSLNIPQNLTEALNLITRAPSHAIDIGRVKYKDFFGEDRERYFLNVSDFGIGGEVVKRVNQNRMKKKAASYLRSLLSAFISFKNKRLRIKIDGRELPPDEYMIGAISNGKIFGKGMKIAPHARLDDGLFDVVLIKGMKTLEFFKNAMRIYSGSHLSHPKVTVIQGKKVEVDTIPDKKDEEEVLIEGDGELLGKAPAVFEIFPRIIPVKSQL